ncbi:hypothetical protein SAMN06265348_10873 [Pedobacter westerhofensis]|uniref:Uncharacterized protein n=1 Tax=Pedobacter westerhofensis TaxID=425512 RepID=A0A521EGG2_9SPHI|nr:hypothetical protein [Pedobacter westerhofensis]SMO83004.1 hypothetical protein SAMN06265348_10873 [Pedobacter westerhofensis]
MIKRILLVALFLCGLDVSAQQIERFNPDTIKTITLDSNVNIVAQKLSVETFIKAVTTDTTFYAAFRRMKAHSFIAENRIYTYDKKNKVNGKIYRKIRHTVRPAKIEYLVKQDTGKVFKKNGKYQLYTVEMFDYIFMNAYQSDFVSDAPSASPKGDSNESYKSKLKTLIFNPGRPVKGIPFIGSKTEIFTANMRQYYDYSFQSGTYLDSIPVYRFRVLVKDGLSNWTKDGLMIKELVTIFDKRNFAILGRYVDMKYSNMLFDFDVQMNIEMSYFAEEKLPSKITYQGNWNIPFKKEERASFLILHKDYQ